MKILHTSDWHLGHQLYGRDRQEEQQSMLDQMVSLAQERQPDVFLISGDVYHTSQPSATVQTMFASAIAAMRRACPEMTIVVLAGNHDSGMRMEIFHEPWKMLNVHSVGFVEKDDSRQGKHIIEIPGVGFVVAVPYTYERNMPDDLFQRLLDAVAQLNHDGLPVVVAAHTTVAGCDYRGHDNSSELTVGGIDALDADVFGSGYDYVALGHIHHAQFLHGTEHRMRYSGSPIAVSFDEAYDHTVTIVSIDRHGDVPLTETIEIDNPWPLVTLPTSGSAPNWESALASLREYPADLAACLRLNVTIDGFLPAGAMEEAQQIVSDKKCQLLHINARRAERETTEAAALSFQELQQIKPLDLLKRFASDTGTLFDDEMEALFVEALDKVNENQREQ